MKYLHFLFFAVGLFVASPLLSQTTNNLQTPTSINTDGAAPDASAMLDVQSTTHGMLVPRMTTAQRTGIAAPATGLLVFDTDTGGFWFYNGNWQSLSGGGGGGTSTSIADADGDTKVQVEEMPDEDKIRFKVAGTEAVVIDENGKLGIGTTTPDQLLTISDASEPVLRFERTNSTAFDYEAYTTSGGKLIFRGGADGTGAALTDFVTFNQLGRVGIGTDQPTAKLDVNGSIHLNLGTNTLLYNGANATGTPGDDAFRMKYEDSFFGLNFDALVFEKTDVNGDDPDGGIAFINTGQDNLSETAMVIRGNGKVGLGTTNPVFQLDLRGKHVADGPIFQMTNSDLTKFVRLFSGRAGDPNPFLDWQSGTDFLFRTANADFSSLTERMRIKANGDVGIGNNEFAAGYKLSVDGKIACEEVMVDLSQDWPDYVFEDDYPLKSLEEVQQHIDEKGHLPGVPSAQEVEANGVVLGEMNKILMEKVEELTLYILQQEERIRALEKNTEARGE